MLEGEEEKESDQLEELKQILAPGGENSKKASEKLGDADRIFGSAWVRPTKVVKKIVRYIQQDGSECTTISYITTPEEVARVQNAAKRIVRRQQEPHYQSAVERISSSSSDMKINFRSISDKVKQAVDEKLQSGNSNDRAVRAVKLAASQGCTISNRHPKIEFSARLEKLVVDLWSMPKSAPFKYPGYAEIPNYLALIDNPICLLDIRKKLGNLHDFKG